MTKLTFVTTCRGRLAHIKQSVPTMVAQPDTACVVVDYGCPQGTGDWVEQHHPEVKVVRSGPRPYFECSRARNLGAAAADTPWLAFVDADSLLAPDFAQVVLPLLEPGRFYRPRPSKRDATGMCISAAADFERVGGYDAVIQGYGKEDRDFYVRLMMEGVQATPFPGEVLSMMTHDEDSRVAEYEIKNVLLNSAINQTYCNIKWDLLRLRRVPMKEESRASLYAKVWDSLHEAHRTGKEMKLRIPVISQETRLDRTLQTWLQYRLAPPGEQPTADSPGLQQRPAGF